MPIFPRTSPLTFGVPRKRRPAIDREQLETVEEHRTAQNAIEFATMRRQYDETMNAALSSAAEAPDEESSQAILDQAMQAASKLQSKNIRVQNAFSAHLEGTMAGWTERFARQAKAAQEKRTHDQGLQEYDAALDAGDLVGAVKITEHLKTIEPENASIYDKMAADAPSASALRQVRGAIAEGNLQGARGFVEQARKLPLTVEQKVDIARLKKSVERGEQDQKDAWLSDMVGQAIESRNLPESEKFAKMEELRAALAANAANFPAASVREMYGFLKSMESEKPVVSNPVIKSDLVDRALQLRDDTPESEVAAFRRELDESLVRGDISNEDYESLRLSATKRGERTDKAASDAIDAVVQSGKERGINDLADLKWQLSQAAKKNKWTPEQIWNEGGNMLPAWKDRPQPPEPEEPPFTEESILKMIGMLERGGRYIDPKTKEVFPFPSARAVRAFVLEFGPEWYIRAPRALEIIRRDWPLSFWKYQTDEEKAATLERARDLKSAFWDSTVLEGDITEGHREMAVEIAPSGPVTPEQVQEFEEYLDTTGKIFPKPVVPAPAPQTIPEYPTATNPNTGEQVIFRDGKWQPL
ncbi:hypothetical protein ES708_08615 [subsurface metagenome]